jgi:hypothetical protein
MLYDLGEQHCRKNKNDQNMKPINIVIAKQGLRDEQKWLWVLQLSPPEENDRILMKTSLFLGNLWKYC